MKKGFITCFMGVASFGLGFFLGGKMLVKMINDYKIRMNRNLSNMMVLNDWLDFLYSGGNAVEYFQKHEYGKIVIYGNGYIGKRLRQALSETDIEVAAVMDKMASSDESGVIGVDDEIPNVDCIVITPVFYYDEIVDMLQKKTTVPVISIQSIWEKGEADLVAAAEESVPNE